MPTPACLAIASRVTSSPKENARSATSTSRSRLRRASARIALEPGRESVSAAGII